MSIDVVNESGFEVDESGLVALARYVLDAQRIHPLAELSVLLVDLVAMERLHKQWMDEPGPTDVLSFPMDELRPGGYSGSRNDDDEDEADPALLGDVVLCPEVARRQAAAAGHSTSDELNLLLTHGILHLLGYDHAEPDEEQQMFDLQRQLLRAWAEQRHPAGGPL